MMVASMPSKKIICADAIEWLANNKCGAIVTSPPDAEEIGLTLPAWREWFAAAVRLCFKASSGPVVFYVTDRKSAGVLWSKPAIIFEAAGDANLAWHKVALRRDVGMVDLHRPGFSHLMAFGARPGTATPDTFKRGNVLYKNGTGLLAARVAIGEGVLDYVCFGFHWSKPCSMAAQARATVRGMGLRPMA